MMRWEGPELEVSSGYIARDHRERRGGNGRGEERRKGEEAKKISLVITQETALFATWKRPQMPTWCANDS